MTAKLCACIYTLQTTQECRWYICYPIHVYDGKVYVLDDVATMEVGDLDLITDKIYSKLIYFVKDDVSSGDIVALQGNRGPSGARGLKGAFGDKGPVGIRGPTRKRGVEEPEGPPGEIGKMGPVVELGHVVKKATRKTVVMLVNKDL